MVKAHWLRQSSEKRLCLRRLDAENSFCYPLPDCQIAVSFAVQKGITEQSVKGD